MFRDSEQPTEGTGECAFIFSNAWATRVREKFTGLTAGCSKTQLLKDQRSCVSQEVNTGHERWGGVRQTNKSQYGQVWAYLTFLSL